MLILSDFSKTFTRADMPTTWSVFAKSGILGAEYTNRRNALYEANIAYEQSGNREKTEAWFLDHARLFVEFGLTEAQIEAIVTDNQYFAPRDGVRELLQFLNTYDIPLVIVTSGVANFVEAWFRLRFDYTPEIIFGNELLIEDGKAVGVVEDSAICPLDKTIELAEISDDEEIIILGDNREDLIVGTAKISLGFTDEERGFAVNLGKDASMEVVLPYLS